MSVVEEILQAARGVDELGPALSGNGEKDARLHERGELLHGLDEDLDHAY